MVFAWAESAKATTAGSTSPLETSAAAPPNLLLVFIGFKAFYSNRAHCPALFFELTARLPNRRCGCGRIAGDAPGSNRFHRGCNRWGAPPSAVARHTAHHPA